MRVTKTNLAFFAACAALWMAGASSALAQRYSASLSDRGYEEMRRLAQRLDATAQHAADQARHQESWVYRHDSRFTRAVTDFARQADRFNDRLGSYRTAPWRVDDELRNLQRSAQDIQNLARRSREADEHTVADWNDAVLVLNRMIRLYDWDVRHTGRYDWNAPLPEFHVQGPGFEFGIRAPGPAGAPPAPAEGRRYPERIVRLAQELDQRATRAHELAEGLARGDGGWRHREYFENIHRFNEQAREFAQHVTSGQNDYPGLREQARLLLEDARRADADMRRNNVFPEVWDEWRGAMQVLEELLNSLRA
jgi:hypothetical protein